MFTQSGTIFVEGFKEGIGREGIQMTRRMSSMPDMAKIKGTYSSSRHPNPNCLIDRTMLLISSDLCHV